MRSAPSKSCRTQKSRSPRLARAETEPGASSRALMSAASASSSTAPEPPRARTASASRAACAAPPLARGVPPESAPRAPSSLLEIW